MVANIGRDELRAKMDRGDPCILLEVLAPQYEVGKSPEVEVRNLLVFINLNAPGGRNRLGWVGEPQRARVVAAGPGTGFGRPTAVDRPARFVASVGSIQ